MKSLYQIDEKKPSFVFSAHDFSLLNNEWDNKHLPAKGNDEIIDIIYLEKNEKVKIQIWLNVGVVRSVAR